MESLKPKMGILVSRISYISNVMVYYGYLHECAGLFRQLCKESREQWDQNLEAITSIIMKYEQCKMVIDLGESFTYEAMEFLLNANNYLYFRIRCKLLYPSDFKYAIKFLNKIEAHSPKMFERLYMDIDIVGGSVCKSHYQIYKHF